MGMHMPLFEADVARLARIRPSVSCFAIALRASMTRFAKQLSHNPFAARCACASNAQQIHLAAAADCATAHQHHPCSLMAAICKPVACGHGRIASRDFAGRDLTARRQRRAPPLLRSGGLLGGRRGALAPLDRVRDALAQHLLQVVRLLLGRVDDLLVAHQHRRLPRRQLLHRGLLRLRARPAGSNVKDLIYRPNEAARCCTTNLALHVTLLMDATAKQPAGLA